MRCGIRRDGRVREGGNEGRQSTNLKSWELRRGVLSPTSADVAGLERGQ